MSQQYPTDQLPTVPQLLEFLENVWQGSSSSDPLVVCVNQNRHVERGHRLHASISDSKVADEIFPAQFHAIAEFHKNHPEARILIVPQSTEAGAGFEQFKKDYADYVDVSGDSITEYTTLIDLIHHPQESTQGKSAYVNLKHVFGHFEKRNKSFSNGDLARFFDRALLGEPVSEAYFVGSSEPAIILYLTMLNVQRVETGLPPAVLVPQATKDLFVIEKLLKQVDSGILSRWFEDIHAREGSDFSDQWVQFSRWAQALYEKVAGELHGLTPIASAA